MNTTKNRPQLTDNRTLTDKYASAITFQRKVARRSHMNGILRAEIKTYLESLEVNLPTSKKEYRIKKAEIFDYETYDSAKEDGLSELCKLYYALAPQNCFMAEVVTNGREDKSYSPMVNMYSRNKLDLVYNYIKAKLIRTRYYTFLQTATDAEGDLLIKKYVPIHLTLTVRHNAATGFEQQEFYARALVEKFRDMRKTSIWKTYVYAGEYGIEITKGKNGLHIHLHALILQYPRCKSSTARKAISTLWKQITGNTTGSSGMHYETLYTIKRDTENKIIYWYDTEGNPYTQKDYIMPGDNLDKYMQGIMECIKYHFKPDALKKENGYHDIELIRTILNNTKNMRMYSRFGAWYNEPLLNFNKLKVEPDKLTNQDSSASEDNSEEDVTGSATTAQANVIHPVFHELMQPEEYNIITCKIQNLLFYKQPKTQQQAPKDPTKQTEEYDVTVNTKMPGYFKYPKGIPLKQAIKSYLNVALFDKSNIPLTFTEPVQ